MKKNHFFFPYAGNKRTEVDKISAYLPNDIDIIVEPYCGSCAVSYYIWTTNKDLQFVLNDNNGYLQELFETVRDPEKEKHFEDKVNEAVDLIRNSEDMKAIYNKLATKDNLVGWFIGNKYYSIRPFLFPNSKTYTFKHVKLSEYPIYEFFKQGNIVFTCKDGVECYMEFQHNPKAYIFLDPPYINTCNSFYNQPSLGIYEYLVNGPSMNKAPAYVMVVVEENYIINLIFSDKKYYCKYHEKTYQTSKKLTRHKLVMNLRFARLDKPTKIITRVK